MITQQHVAEEIDLQELKVYDIRAGLGPCKTRTVDSMALSLLNPPNGSPHHEIGTSNIATIRIGDAAALRDITAALHDAAACDRAICAAKRAYSAVEWAAILILG